MYVCIFHFISLYIYIYIYMNFIYVYMYISKDDELVMILSENI